MVPRKHAWRLVLGWSLLWNPIIRLCSSSVCFFKQRQPKTVVSLPFVTKRDRVAALTTRPSNGDSRNGFPQARSGARCIWRQLSVPSSDDQRGLPRPLSVIRNNYSSSRRDTHRRQFPRSQTAQRTLRSQPGSRAYLGQLKQISSVNIERDGPRMGRCLMSLFPRIWMIPVS